MAEEVAGIKATDPMAYPANGRATTIIATQNKDLQTIVNDPTLMMIDNEAISKMLHLRNITKKTKNLRRCGRMIQFMRGMVQEVLSIMKTVWTKAQKANPMTKIIISVKQHLAEMEFTMGRQQSLDNLQQLAKQRGNKRIGQRMQKHKRPTPETIEGNKEEEKEKENELRMITNANTESNRNVGRM